jgi:hypothetical protein
MRRKVVATPEGKLTPVQFEIMQLIWFRSRRELLSMNRESLLAALGSRTKPFAFAPMGMRMFPSVNGMEKTRTGAPLTEGSNSKPI